MKLYCFFMLLLLSSAVTCMAQQKIKVSMSIVTMLVIPVNPGDTLFMKAFSNDKNRQPFPSFVAMPDAQFYSEKETETTKLNLDKVNHPDNYFQSEEEYHSFIEDWFKQLSERRNKRK